MNYPGSTNVLIGNQSYIGRVSRDSHAIAFFPSAQEEQNLTTLAVVAEGHMGYPRGVNKAAAEIVVSSFVEVFGRSIPTQPRKLFTEAIETASERLLRYREVHAAEYEMLATCAAVVVMSDRLYTVSIGNCRLYLLREKRLRQISIDHTALQALLERGQIARQDPRKQMMLDGMPFTRCLGTKPHYPQYELPDFRLRFEAAESDEQAEANQGLQLQSDDQILLCTDGMYGRPRFFPDVEDEQIRNVLLSQEHPQAAAEALITLALKEMWDVEDITAIVLKFKSD